MFEDFRRHLVNTDTAFYIPSRSICSQGFFLLFLSWPTNQNQLKPHNIKTIWQRCERWGSSSKIPHLLKKIIIEETRYLQSFYFPFIFFFKKQFIHYRLWWGQQFNWQLLLLPSYHGEESIETSGSHRDSLRWFPIWEHFSESYAACRRTPSFEK